MRTAGVYVNDARDSIKWRLEKMGDRSQIVVIEAREKKIFNILKSTYC